MPSLTSDRLSSANGLLEDPPPYHLYWFGSIVLAAAFAGTLAFCPPVLAEPTTPAPQWMAFLGRFHPIILHLPVGVLILQVLIELLCLRSATEYRWGPVALFILFVATAGAVKASIYGVFLARSGGYTDGGTFFMHQALCLGMTAVLLVALFLRLSAMSSGGKGTMHAYRGALLLCMSLMSVGAHFGANLVHGSTYLTKYAPPAVAEAMHGFENWVLKLAPAKASDPTEPKSNDSPSKTPSNASPNPSSTQTPPATTSGGKDKLVFQDVVLPILEDKCNSCHNADKDKGDLRMDTHELLLKGGSEEGMTVIPGKPDESLLVQRVMLPLDDDEHMPPDMKPELTPQELALIKWWIQSGASASQKVADSAGAPPEAKSLLTP
ncbi:MAG: hypothetical protein JNJ83_07570 [Verrucomicrobiaceae bacterium]|nr:hypothetical protein [Verrucomicrobiaceae bacterium]